MKIVLCQINPILGNFKYNQKLIESTYKNAANNGADLVVFPELCLTGYPPKDLLFNKDFIKRNLKLLNEIALISTIPIILGFIRSDEGNIYNSAALCSNGRIISEYDKILLPTYDVFDEKRYFTSGTEIGIWSINYNGYKKIIGIQICEDLWDDGYSKKITKLQKESGAEIIINISASPYHKNRLDERLELVKNKIEKYKLPIFYCNLFGAQDDLIFDGQSFAFDEMGGCLGIAKSFRKDTLEVNLVYKNIQKLKPNNINRDIFNGLCLGVKDYFFKSGIKKAVIGLSGGIDSALVAAIATHALGNNNVYGVTMPSDFSSDHSIKDSKELASNLEIDFITIPIQNAVTSIEKTLFKQFEGKKRDTTEENIQARIRGDILMALSNKFGWLVLSTGNKTELALGYCTLYGDMSGGLSVISDLNKMDVYELVKWFNNAKGSKIPQNIITKPPSAELAPNQIDPFDYNIVSPIVDLIIEDRLSIDKIVSLGYEKNIVLDVYLRIKKNEYKRKQAPLGLRISKKAFGGGRRFPIINHYMEGET